MEKLDWINLAQHRKKLRALVNEVINFYFEICPVLGRYAA